MPGRPPHQGAERWPVLHIRLLAPALRSQTAAAQTVLGRVPIHIGMIHATAVIADALSAILDAFIDEGVEFVDLDEAMADPANVMSPELVTGEFKNLSQKRASSARVFIPDAPPDVLAQVEEIAPIPGHSADEVVS